MYVVIYCLCLLMSIEIEVVFLQETRQFIHELVPGKRFDDSAVLENRTFTSVTWCLIDCASVTDCVSVSWNANTGFCQLSSVDITHHNHLAERMFDDVNWSGYARITYKVLNVRSPLGRYQLSFQQAKEECEALGYTMATPNDLREARDAGMSVCACGWVSDETNVQILQEYNVNCWFTFTDGYEMCSKLLADAWCKRP